MSESPLPYPKKGPTKKEQIIALTLALHERGETFPFPGIDPESYARMKAGEEEDPGYTTPIDEIIQRLRQEGMKIVLGKILKAEMYMYCRHRVTILRWTVFL